MLVQASQLVELVGSELSADGYGEGDAGEVTIRTERLVAREGGGIFTSTFGAGRGGDLTVEASESLDLIGTTSDGRFKSGFASNAFMNATEATGNLRIETKRLTIRDGAGIGAATFGAAQGGKLTIEVSELVELIGTSADGRELSSLNVQSQGRGAAGDIEIDTRRLVVRDGGLVSTATEEAGRAGRLVVRASESVEVSGTSADGQFPSSLRSDASFDAVPSGFLPPPQSDVLGQAGDLTIETGELRVRNGAEITVSGEGFGAAGNIRIEADSLQLEGGGKINAATASGAGGNIILEGDNLLLRGGSTISTNADNADGGNITIDTGTLVALENSDISANARAGVGGRVTINASGIFGTQFREAQTPESDITATSALGPQFNGLVEVNITNVAPSQGFVNLPENVTDSTELIAIGCADEQQNSFVVTGRGGLPEDPTQMLRGRTVWRDLRLMSGNGGEDSETRGRQAVTNSATTSHSPIVEATGWTLNAEGQVELIARVPNAALPKMAECYASESR
jgi:large exoprotein involved in heme utilization and adhesion